MKILVINGPNLNMLGEREPDKYGSATFDDVKKILYSAAFELNVNVEIVQSNIEGELVDYIQQAKGVYDGIVINPAAYTHTSVALRDAILAVNLPVVEIHISNIYKREEFRQHSYIAPVAIGQISGFGVNGYALALRAIVDYLMS